jgi:translation initiation factor IF-2
MSDVTIKQLAAVLGTPVDKLLAQLAEAGMNFSDPEQSISSTEKVKLLGFLRRNHGKGEPATEDSAPRQVTLKRRTVSELTVNPGQRGSASKTVNVEVRQKRTYVKRSVVEDQGKSIDPEREDALRKLEESQARRDAEEQVRQESDRRRLEEEAKAKAAEGKRACGPKRKCAPKSLHRSRAPPPKNPKVKARARRRRWANRRQVARDASMTVQEPLPRVLPGVMADPSTPVAIVGVMARAISRQRSISATNCTCPQEGSARRTGRKKPRAKPTEPARGSATHGFFASFGPGSSRSRDWRFDRCCRPCATHGGQGRRSGQGLVQDGCHGDHQPGHRPRHRATGG